MMTGMTEKRRRGKWAWIIALMVVGGSVHAVEFPFQIYKDANPWENHGAPSGWMGDFRDLKLDLKWKENPYSGETCIRFDYSAKGSHYANMIGVMWQNPANNVGDIDGGVDLRGATKVTFWARGERGGEYIEAFMLGGTIGAYPDTDKGVLQDVYLTREWKPYAIDLTGLDLSYISSFFGWATSRFRNPDGMIFYLDEIVIEGMDPTEKQEAVESLILSPTNEGEKEEENGQ